MKKTKRKQREKGGGRAVVAGAFTQYVTERPRAASAELFRGDKEIQQVLKTYRRARHSQKAGRVAEVLHAATFNAVACLKGRNLRARTTHSLGQPCATADVVVYKHGRIVGRAQMKYEKTALRNAAAISNPKYRSHQRVVPSDQVRKVKRVATAGAAKAAAAGRRRKAAERLDAAVMTSDILEVAGIKSDRLSSREAKRLARHSKKLRSRAAWLEISSAAKAGALAGVATGALTSGQSNLLAYRRGRKTASQALLHTGVELAKSGASGAAVAVAEVGTRQLLVKAGARTLAKGSAPVVLVQFGLEVSMDVIDVACGRISGEEAARNTGRNAVKAASGWAGAEAGAAIGTMLLPGVGTVIGGMAGGFLGYVIGDKMVG